MTDMLEAVALLAQHMPDEKRNTCTDNGCSFETWDAESDERSLVFARHQFQVLSEAGMLVVSPDQEGLTRAVFEATHLQMGGQLDWNSQVVRANYGDVGGYVLRAMVYAVRGAGLGG